MLSVNELFSGIGSQRKALERLGIPHQVVGISEIDKYAIKSYEAIFGGTRNYGDISVIDKLDYADFWTYSFPCQDISVSGKQAGINENTRSGLLYQVERLLNEAKLHNELPKYLMLENVKNLVGKKFKAQFDEWLEFLNELGYNNYWQVLNAKDYGIPQNRERVFVISIRKNIDDGRFEFPKAFDNGIRLKDILEIEVEEKFYISNDKVSRFITELNNKDTHNKNVNLVGKLNSSQDGVVVSPNGISPTHTAGHGNCPKIIEDNNLIQVGTLKGCGMPYDKMHDQSGRVYNPDGIAPTVNTCGGGNLEPKILETPCICASRGRYNNYNKTEQQIEINSSCNTNTITTVQKDNLLIEPNLVIGSTQKNAYIGNGQQSSTLTSAMGEGGGHVPMIGFNDLRIRKLTPKECWRLMGFDDEDFEKAQTVNSNSQLYKQAGNSIVVDVLYYIFKNAFKSYIIDTKKTA